MPVTFVSVSILDLKAMKFMALPLAEQVARSHELFDRPQARGHSFNNEDPNPYPQWLITFIEKMAAVLNGKAYYDGDNQQYRVQLPVNMKAASAWSKECTAELEKEKASNPEACAWSSENLLQFGMTDSDELSAMADLENHYRGARKQKEAQDEDADEEADSDIEESA